MYNATISFKGNIDLLQLFSVTAFNEFLTVAYNILKAVFSRLIRVHKRHDDTWK